MSKKVPVSVRAVVQRINRKLKLKSQKLIKRRDGYHVIDFDRNIHVESNFNLESFGRKFGAIEEWESVEG